MNAKLIVVAFTLLAACATAQWTKVRPNLLADFPEDCCGFGSLHYKDGKVWAGADTLFVSSDFGLTWSYVFTPPKRITEINFFDTKIGVVSTLDGVYKTTTGGTTWSKILTSPNCLGAQFAGSPLRIAVAADNAGFFYSDNGGATWEHQEAGQHPHFVLANADGSAFGFSGGISPPDGWMFRRQSSGGPWVPSQRVDYDCFNAVRHHCSGKIFLMNEEGHIFSDSIVSILVSTDEGGTWEPMFTGKPTRFFSAGMSVSPCCVLYCQTIAEGIMRTTDEGQTWKNIGGPSNVIDTRTVCAITDNLILAVDQEGSIWRTINSGGDSVYKATTVQTVISTPASAIDPAPNVEILVPISVKSAVAKTSFDLVVHYDSMGYLYRGSFAKGGGSIDVVDQSWPGRARIRFRAQDIPDGTGIIGYSLFKIKWYEPFCDIVRFDSAQANVPFCGPNVVWTQTETIVGNYTGCAMSVSDQTRNPLDLSIKPNPSDGVFSIIGTTAVSDVSVMVLDVIGRIILERTGDIFPDRPLAIDLNNEPAGTYYVRIEHRNMVQTLQAVKR